MRAAWFVTGGLPFSVLLLLPTRARADLVSDPRFLGLARDGWKLVFIAVGIALFAFGVLRALERRRR